MLVKRPHCPHNAATDIEEKGVDDLIHQVRKHKVYAVAQA